MTGRRFRYYFYGDDVPRSLFGKESDAVLSVILSEGGTADLSAMYRHFGTKKIDALTKAGLFRQEAGKLLTGCTVFLKEDLPILESIRETIRPAADRILFSAGSFRRTVSMLDNGFEPSVNLFHLLCGTVFDGLFFDLLAEDGTISVSHIHPDGSDYLITVYEQDPVLEKFSRQLICSYNRFSSGSTALQSFGDADGDRRDFFRFDQKMKARPESCRNDPAFPLWNRLEERKRRSVLLSETVRLVQTGHCDPVCLALLTEFGYARSGSLAVPVYGQNAAAAAETLCRLTAGLILDEIRTVLLRTSAKPLFSTCCGIPCSETANELFHILFGTLNMHLIKSGLAAVPPYVPGEGRFLRSVQLY